jgi:hypothetical protein
VFVIQDDLLLTEQHAFDGAECRLSPKLLKGRIDFFAEARDRLPSNSQAGGDVASNLELLLRLSVKKERVQGDPRGPGGPPHNYYVLYSELFFGRSPSFMRVCGTAKLPWETCL